MMNRILTICNIVLMFSVLALLNTQSAYSSNGFNKSTCPIPTRGGKAEPSEESDLHACKQYSCNSCCTSNITTQLAAVPLQQVGIVNYNQCPENPLSDACSRDYTFIECMYHCSPNLFPWISVGTKKLRSLPICASFCDAWFFACQYDLTCAVGKGNLITDIYKGFYDDGTPKDPCKEPRTCRNYTTVYQSGEQMCNTIWGNLFVYTPDSEDCLNPGKPSENTQLVHNMDETYEVSDCITATATYTDAGLIVGVVFGVLAAIFIIVAGVLLYLRKKKEKDSPDAPARPKPKEPAVPEEMATLKSPTTEKPPTPSNTAGHSDSEAEEA